MGIPNIGAIRKINGAIAQVKIVGCCSCKQPLWELHNVESRNYHLTKKVSIGTVPAWSEYWSKDGKTPLRVDCPYCHEEYFKVLTGPDGYTVPKMWLIGIDDV